MNDVVKFDYKGANIRTVLVNNEPWFVVRDICCVFGMQSNGAYALVKRLDEDESNSIRLTDNMGRPAKVIIVNESGLYKIILRSDKPRYSTQKKAQMKMKLKTCAREKGQVKMRVVTAP